MEMNQAFGTQLRSARQQAGLSQDELAHLAGLHRTFVSLLERGLRNPTLDTILKLCRALDLEPGAFVSSVEQLADSDNQ